MYLQQFPNIQTPTDATIYYYVYYIWNISTYAEYERAWKSMKEHERAWKNVTNE